jgi:subtilisin-like proprotein convertase family protein
MRLCTLLCCFFFSAFLSAQTTAPNFFKPLSENAIALPEKAERKLIPIRYQTYQLDYAGIKAALENAPKEFTPEARQQRCIIALPMADGTLEEFSVWEISILEPALAAETPYIRTFAGESLRDKAKTVRLSHTLRGFRAMVVRSDMGAEFIEPYAWGQDVFYMVYDAHDIPAEAFPQGPRTVVVDPTWLEKEAPLYTPPGPVAERGTELDPVVLKQYKLIISTTGEFALDHGGNKQLVFSALAEYVNLVNVPYERDFALRFQLVQATLLTIFLDPDTDPFFGPDNGALASQNQQALATVGVTPNGYDIGHVFARGGGGVGGLGVICQSSKWLGCTAGSGSYGAGFIYVACQELGHQLGGNHSWNRCGGFAEDQRAPLTAYEPGSGSTIMSYVGGCGSDNVQGGADLYFHGGSIKEMRKVIDFEAGSQCGANIPTTNMAPTVTLPYQNNFFIPIGTAFELNGSATDPDGDALTYCWEEIDLGPEAPLGTQVASSPIFRTRPAVSVTNRYFPQLSTILNGTTDSREILPAYTRDLTFKLTVRDNHSGGGGVASADVAFKAWGDAGPFLVQYPNLVTDTWSIGEYTEVRWDVANTDKPPVNCSHVNIRLSTDGGLTYPITLAQQVGNDGSHYVLVPDLATTQARIRVDGYDNVFFDISNRNFTIKQPTQPSATLSLNNDSGILCLPAEHQVSIASAGVLGFTSPIALELDGLPANVIATFSATTLQPGENATLTLDFSQVQTEETFTLTLRATVAGMAPILRPIVLTTLRNDFSALALVTPTNGATELTLNQTLYWNRALDALTYDVQFASSPSFAPGTILASVTSTTLDSFKVPVFLAKGTPYYWRVRPKNECGTHAWTEPFFFSTFAEQCYLWSANDLPKNMSANGMPTIESKITVNAGGAIKNMEVRQIKGYHEFFKDLDVRLISPQGTEVVLWSARCGNFNGFFNLRLNDAAPSPFPCPPPNTGIAYRPQDPLAAFIGQNSTGTWTLRAKDTQFGGGGTFEFFDLEFCSEVSVNPPYLVNNNTLFVEPGNNRVITPDLLLVEDPNNTHSQLLFTLLTVPTQGHLARSWSAPLQPGDQFTQADLDNGAIRFFDYGGNYATDGFRFMVTDGEGGYFGTPRFNIQPPPVGTNEPGRTAFDFHLFPNPANDMVWVAMDAPLRDQARVALFNTAGQMMLETILPAGAERLQLRTAGLPRGIYLVQVGAAVRKVVLR